MAGRITSSQLGEGDPGQGQECAEGREGEYSPGMGKAETTLFMINTSLVGACPAASVVSLTFSLIPAARYKRLDPSY